MGARFFRVNIAPTKTKSFDGETIMQGVAPLAGRRERAARKIRRPFRRALLDDKTASRRSQRSQATSERILDSAEELFAKHGIYGVTMREIAELAHVDTALLHYYFESKRGVFDAVFARRADVLIDERTLELDRYESESGGDLSVEGIIAAYLRPAFRLNRENGTGWRYFCAFVTTLSSTPELAEVFAQKFDPILTRLMGLLRRALPEAEEVDLYWGYHFFSGSMMIVNAANSSIEHFSSGLCNAENFEAIEPRMVAYSSAGFRSLCVACAGSEKSKKI
ncbi:MAG TPA: TetR/AcrR family transcriptional regulator [Rhizomicrobium sp.]|nr:TetR/AcrR family transcriptional regulator [Rhizomicrobium sp.]